VGKKPNKNSPIWLDEDPDDGPSSTANADLYGDIKTSAKFGKEENTAPPKSEQAKSNSRDLLRLFCESIGLELRSDKAVLDLHGLRLAEAIQRTEKCVLAIVADGRIKTLQVITGKGNHSQGLAVLAREVHPHVKDRFAQSIKDISVNPRELLDQGLPYKGFFEIEFF
jgi:DNA-nicking Smr family endonuclease